MSVLIKAMDMPNNCLECNFEYDCMMCKITGTSFIWGEDGKVRIDFYEEEQRLPDCPLVEVPTPHGRLIDADLYEYHMQGEWERNEISNSDWINFRERINEEETVIESED